MTLSRLASISVPVLICGLFVLVQSPLHAKLAARDNVNKGIQQFREAEFESAVESFKRAAQLDPDWTSAELYLGTAYAQQFIPGSTTPHNVEFANNAIASFERVLRRDSENVRAIAGLAGIYHGQLHLRKARDYYSRAAALEPGNVQWWYSAGVMDWFIVQDKQQELSPAAQAVFVKEGLKSIDQALALDPEHTDSMIYKNLLLREEARLTDDAVTKARLNASADEWFNKAQRIRFLN
jgi:tetratricopeptide (TPR) repeat protein